MKENFNELNNEKLENQNPKIINLGFKHNSIIVVNGKLNAFDFKVENFKDKNFSPISELELDYLLNFFDVSKDSSMQSLNIALHEGGFKLNIKPGYKFKYPIIIFNYFSGILENKIINNSEIINMSKNSDATLIEFYIDDSKGRFLKNTFKYIDIEDEFLVLIIIL